MTGFWTPAPSYPSLLVATTGSGDTYWCCLVSAAGGACGAGHAMGWLHHSATWLGGGGLQGAGDDTAKQRCTVRRITMNGSHEAPV